jgi:hypothetical protein
MVDPTLPSRTLLFKPGVLALSSCFMLIILIYSKCRSLVTAEKVYHDHKFSPWSITELKSLAAILTWFANRRVHICIFLDQGTFI